MSNTPTLLLFDTHPFEKDAFEAALGRQPLLSGRGPAVEVQYTEVHLNEKTAALCEGFSAVCAFVNDRLHAPVIEKLAARGVKLLALRCAGYNHVDLEACKKWGIRVIRVPEYSPYAVAEHAVALYLCLNRKIHKAYHRVREGNFSLVGLVGSDLHQKTVGVVGTGKIGKVFAQIMRGFGAQVLAYDLQPDLVWSKAHQVQYVEDTSKLFRASDVISLHVPLTPQTRYLVNAAALAEMKPGVVLINTSRGGLMETSALIQSLKTGHVGGAGLDVYEEEAQVFFEDHSEEVLQDDVLARLLTFPNVLLTSHQAFLTHEALRAIAETTLTGVSDFFQGRTPVGEIGWQ